MRQYSVYYCHTYFLATNTWLAKAWTAIDRLLVIWKLYLTDKIKRNFFQAVAVSILLDGCTTWTLWRKAWWQLNKNTASYIEATPHKTTAVRSPTMKTIKVRRSRHAGHCWRSKDKLMSDILLWTPSHKRAKVERPAINYIQQLCADTGCSLDDLLRAMDNRDGWWERARGSRSRSATWWW